MNHPDKGKSLLFFLLERAIVLSLCNTPLHYEVLRHWAPRIIDLTSQFLLKKVPESFDPYFPKRLSRRAIVWEWTLDRGA